jgi:pimeloyl-ACP methyl ester carboxylesterase
LPTSEPAGERRSFSSTGSYADVLAAFTDALDLGRAHFLGLSWGGVVAQGLHERHPDRVRSLILTAATAGWRGSLPEAVCEQRLASSLRESELAPEEWVHGWLPGLLTERASQELRDEVVEFMSDFHPAGYRAMARMLASTDTRPLLPRIQVPTLLLWGDDDGRSPLSVAEQLRDGIPGATLVVIPDAGHLSNLEQPARFNAAVRDFAGRPA